MRRRDVLTLAVLGAAAGCTGSRKKRIAVIPKSTSHLFWLTCQAGAMAAGEEFGVEILWNGPPAETEYSRQIQILDSMIAQRVDGIALAATERKALIAPVERAVKAGIPITVFDSGLDSDIYTSFVATNNFEAGQLAARKLAELVGGKGEIAILLHAPGSVSTMDRESGFKDVMSKEFPGVRIVAEQFGMSDRAKSRAATENFLAANPRLSGMFASAEPGSIGAALAIKARGAAGRVKFVAFDSSDVMIEDLKAGVMQAFVVQDPFFMAHEAVKTLVDKLNGKTPPKRVDLTARVITAPDLDKPDVQKLLNPDVKKYVSRG